MSVKGYNTFILGHNNACNDTLNLRIKRVDKFRQNSEYSLSTAQNTPKSKLVQCVSLGYSMLDHSRCHKICRGGGIKKSCGGGGWQNFPL